MQQNQTKKKKTATKFFISILKSFDYEWISIQLDHNGTMKVEHSVGMFTGLYH